MNLDGGEAGEGAAQVLEGVPDDVLQLAAQAPQRESEEGRPSQARRKGGKGVRAGAALP